MNSLNKEKLLNWIEVLKIKSDLVENFVWYDQALQDVQDAINRGEFHE